MAQLDAYFNRIYDDLTPSEIEQIDSIATLRREECEKTGRKLLFDFALCDSDLGRYFMEFVPGKKGKHWSPDDAAAAGHLFLVQSLHMRGLQCTPTGANDAAKFGRLDVLKWLHNCTTVAFSTETANTACRWGNLDVLIWLHSKGVDCDVNVDVDALGFHFNTLSWLVRKRLLNLETMWRRICTGYRSLTVEGDGSMTGTRMSDNETVELFRANQWMR